MSTTDQQITEAVRERYGAIARQVLAEQTSGCCTPATQGHADCCAPQGSGGCCTTASGASCCSTAGSDAISADLYLVDELEGLPRKATLASLGCGNPTALAQLQPGEVVLDLGSGGGIDVLVSARRVGPTGFAYGLDLTDEMLALARQNAADAGATNVAFLKGDIAAVPLPDASVDVIISNCVINLAHDKAPVLREAFRVLKPGGRFAVSDIVIHGGLPTSLIDTAELRRDLSAWAGCIAGALTDAEYEQLLYEAGFTDVELEITRRYTVEQLGTPTPVWVTTLGAAQAAAVVERFVSTFIRATKPSQR